MPDRDAADDIRSLISFDDLEHNSVTSSIRAGKVRRNWRLPLTGVACCFVLAWFAIRPEARTEQVSYLVTLRHLVETERRGTPDCSMLEPPVRRLAMAQSARTRAVLRRMGTLKSMRFLRQLGPEHIYELWFEHGRMLWGVVPSPAGTFYSVRFMLREQG